jgi:hypothetical protein
MLPDSRVAYSPKKTWRDGATHVVMEPQCAGTRCEHAFLVSCRGAVVDFIQRSFRHALTIDVGTV